MSDFFPSSMSAIGARRLRQRLAGSEFDTLTDAQQVAVVTAIQTGQRINTADGGEAYAYPQGNGRGWGFNGGETGFCIARGVVEG